MCHRSSTHIVRALLIGGWLSACHPVDATTISIPDAALRGALERALEKQPGERISRADMRALSHLQVSREGITVLTGLEFASNLQSLDLSGNAISDTSPLAHLSRLTELDLSSNRVTDLSPLSGLCRLARLFLAANLITDLTPLARVSALVTLDISYNQIPEIASLADLVHLRELDFSYNDVSDLTPLTNLSNLVVLDMNSNAIRELRPIGNLRKLNSLGFDGNLVEDLEPLAELHALSALDMAANAVRDLWPLANKTQLWYLDASNNEITDISHVASLRGLIRLGLDENDIEVLPSFDLPALRVLSIFGNRVADLSPIASLGGLSTLVVTGNQIGDLDALRGLTQLNYLAAEDNSIVDLSPLSELVEIGTLRLHGNAIADLSPIAELSGLVSLHLDGNIVSDLSPLEGLENLGELSLADNAVSDLSPLSAHRLIFFLVLDNNRISDLAPLENVESLGFLSVERNAVADLSPLVWGTALEKGDEVRLASNPLSEWSLESHVPSLVDMGVWVNVRTGDVPVMISPGITERQSLVRVVNDSGTDHLLGIETRDAQGTPYYAVLPDGSLPSDPDLARQTLVIPAHGATQFNSSDFVAGSPRKGLPRGVGTSPRIGDSWRVVMRGPSADVDVQAYSRSADGAVAPLGRFVTAESDGHRYRIRTFNPASNINSRSLLRLINPGFSQAEVVIDGVDDVGVSRGEATLRIPGLTYRTIYAADLESGGRGIAGSIGNGQGKWRLTVTSNRRLEVANLLESAQGGYLTNLHSPPVRTEARSTGTKHLVPLFECSATFGVQAFARVINLSNADGEASILAVDDAGRVFGPARLFIRSTEAVQFNSDDLSRGNQDRGLTSGTGAPMASGCWRLAIESSLHLEVFAFVRASGGFVANHSRAITGGDHGIPFFNPASNTDQVSVLRLINWRASSTEIEIQAMDDVGATRRVGLALEPGEARMLTSQELEGGTEGLTGMLGDGVGKWRLTVKADKAVDAMSLLSTPNGRVTNLTASP